VLSSQPLHLRDGALVLGLTRLAAPPARLEGVLAITDSQGVRSAYTLEAPLGAMPAMPAALPLWQAALLAALGGLILNLMPCVFPVLAMKAVGLARMAGAARGAIRAEALWYSAGVLVAFVGIGAALLGLRMAGSAAGWGFQFTEPVFVAVMAWLMLAVGLNLSGAFSVPGVSMRGGHAGSFGTGVLAVAVATPCTAPFMAVALGAAMAMPPAATLAVFAALGAGMALPWLLLAAAPGLMRALPRPGAWMERLRQALAFPMYGAAAWLAWVLAEMSGADGVALALGGAVLVGFAAWAFGAFQGRAGRGVAVVALAGALALLPMLREAPAVAAAGAHEAWSAARVAALRAEGRPVFVNLTAAWCITCKVNERVALETDAVRAAFAAAGVVLLVGDWTRGDAAIGALLREHGREGVPLYLFYPAGGGEAQVLPPLLTEAMVLRAITPSAPPAAPSAPSPRV
jgi:thiol:disulfide interchange protein